MRKFKSVEILRPFVRDSGFPLDATTLFHSYGDAVEYARSNPAAYASQIVAVVDEDARKTNLYKIDYDPNGHYAFVLGAIDVGSGAASFRFSGEVDTFSIESKAVNGAVDVESIGDFETVDCRTLPEDADDDGMTQLPDDPAEGSVYYISSEGKYAIARKSGDSIEWADYSQLPASASDGDCYLIESTGQKLIAYHDEGELRWRPLTELPDNPSSGEMYSVEDQNRMYVAYSHNSSTEWKELSIDMKVGEVSKSASGIMRHEAYSTMFNDTGRDALYFSRPEEQDKGDYAKAPDSNRWIGVDHTEVEAGSDYMIPSTGTVSYMLNSAIRVLHEHPYVEATPIAATEYEVRQRFTPEFDIAFHRQYSGRAHSFEIECSSGMANLESHSAEIDVGDMEYDAERQEYRYHFIESKSAYSNEPASVTYSIKIKYYTTDDELYSETASAEVSYSARMRMSCGVTGDMTRELGSALAEAGGTLDLRYDPSEYSDFGGYVTGLYFTIPSSMEIGCIEYMQQHDVQALGYFKKSSDGEYDTYSYELPGGMRFESAGEYVCRLK